MKRVAVLFLSLMFATLAFSQGKHIQEQIARHERAGEPFIMQTPLRFTGPLVSPEGDPLTDGEIFQLDKPSLQSWNEGRSRFIRFEIPRAGGYPLKLKLMEVDLLTEDFQVTISSTQGGTEYLRGKYYHGIVEGAPGSVAAISVFGDKIMGVIETSEEGNMILGPLGEDISEEYILYSVADFTEELPFQCGTASLADVTNSRRPANIGPESGNAVTNCVRAYLECEHDMYLEKGSVQNTVDHMTGLFNVVALLYSNDNMSTNISEIFVWDTPDSYATNSTSAALNSFRDFRTTYNGDVAHLVSRGAPTGGGVAWVDALCTSYAYAYSYIYSNYNQYPTYSWSVNVIAHEMGHNLGAWHTHDCEWTVNGTPNQAIDGCGEAAGYAGRGNCPTGPLPSSGTIMSYCHLVGGVGIDFTEGFHSIVAGVLQSEISAANCLNVCNGCNVSVSITATHVSCPNGNNGSATANPSGGISPYTYAWSNGATTQTISGLSAGNYTVTVTDADNCTQSESISITQPTPFSLSTQVTNETLPGAANGSVILSVSGGTPGYRYIWSNGATTRDIFGLIAGTYTVTVTDNNNCTAVTSATVYAGGCDFLVDQFPYDESFEGGLGNWTQDNDDNINWTRRSGSTPSSGTGPSSAYDGSYYLYTEASGNPGALAGITSPCFDLSTLTGPEFSFAYHMYGSDMGTLTLKVSTDNGATWTDIWTLSGDQGNQWFTQTISLENYISAFTKLKFVGRVGPSFRSDMAFDAVSITENVPPCTPPSLTFSATNVSCNGGANGTASVVASGGVQPYTYAWSNGATTAQITGLTAGTYSVTVTDAANCSASGTQRITEPSLINLGFSVTNESFPGANNGAVDLSVTGGTPAYSYLWSNGATTEDISGLAAGTYTVTVSDANNCTETGSATVHATQCDVVIDQYPYQLGLESGFGDWEQDNTDNLDWTRRSGSTPSSGTGPSGAYEGSYYMYTEASGNNNKTARLESPCFDLSNLTDPDIQFAYHMYGTDMGTLALEVSTDNGNSWTELWSLSGNQGNQWFVQSVSLSGHQTASTKLRFVGTTGNGFRSDMAVDDIIVDGNVPPCNAPSLSMSKTDVTCPGGSNGTASVSANGGVPPYTYLWSNGATTTQITGLTAGNYSVTVTDATNCESISSINVIDPDDIVLNFAVTNESFAGAGDGAIDLTVTGGTPGYSYVWSNGATTQDLSGLGAGTYTVTVTDRNSCTQTGSATVNVTPQCTPLVSFPYFESFENGLGDWVQDPGDNFDWTRRSGRTPSSGTGPSAASHGSWYMYTEATGQFGTAILEGPCVDLSGTTDPELSFDYHMYGQNMGILELEISTDGGATWSAYWSLSGNQGNQWLTHVSSLVPYIGQTVRFRFLGTIGNGFRSDMAIDAFNIGEGGNLPAGLENPDDETFQITQLYPNPAFDQVTVKLTGRSGGTVSWSIIDQLGREWQKGVQNPGENVDTFIVRFLDIPAGMYMIVIRNENELRSLPFIIQR